jgi:nucleoside-diphosphate-sugar epimerase
MNNRIYPWINLTGKKVLLVGGAGYIGGLTCDRLIENGFDVTVYDNLLYENRFLKQIPFIYGDIRDTDKLHELSKDFDIIILMAALVGDPACSVDPELTESINYKAIKDFCEVVSPSKHLIFMSTCSVYGAQDGLLNEESSTNPLSSYASTKLMAEKYILEKNGTVFRLGTVFGLGDTYSRIRMDLVVNVLTMKAIKNGEITINGGEQWRPIIAVKDIGEYIVEACVKKYSGIFILSKENILIRELGEKIVKLIPNTKLNYTEISFQDARNYRVDNSKSLSIFDYKPIVSVEEEVSRMINMFREKRIKDPEEITYHNGIFLKNKKEKKEFK